MQASTRTRAILPEAPIVPKLHACASRNRCCMIPWLAGRTPFPPLAAALDEPNGLLAAGGDLSPERLLDAYRQRHLSRGTRRSAGALVESRSADGAVRRRVSRLAVAAQARAGRNLRDSRRHRVPRRDRGVAPSRRGRAVRHVDHAGDHRRLQRAAPARLRALGRELARRAVWSAGSTAWRSAACSSANRCSRASPMRRRSRSCISWRSLQRARRPADRLPAGDRAPRSLRRAADSARERFAARLAELVNSTEPPAGLGATRCR